MPQTLDTLAEQITALRTHVDRRLDELNSGLHTQIETVDSKAIVLAERITLLAEHVLPARLEELKSGLQTQIEAVDTKISLVLEKVDHLIERDTYHSVVHPL